MRGNMDYGAIRNLPEMFFESADRLGDRPFLWAKRDNAWGSISWRAAADEVVALSNGLTALGIEPGDRVALISENRPEWLIADLAIMSAGAITVPTYTTNTVDDHLHVFNDSGAKALIVSTPALAERALAAAAQVPETLHAITIESPDGAPVQGVRTLSWDATKAGGDGAQDDVQTRIASVQRTDTSCIIYTSGTSGKPKGVMLSHGAILCNCMGAYELVRELPDFSIDNEVFLSFLPLSHSYEHTAGQFLPISIGAQIYYAEGIDKLTANLAETQPTVMTAVPRLYEAMHTRIRRGVERTSGLRRILFEKTVELGTRAYEQPESMGPLDRAFNGVLDKLVRAKVSERFGGRLKAFVSGGAPLNYDIGVFFTALGVRILQGYGQTEAAPVVSCNTARLNKMHTVGPPLKGVQVRIAEDGEILIRGELVMQGYWNNSEATAETINDGWLHTGDIGVLDDDGFIQITDRKKDIIVNSGGDNISPARIEGMLTAEPELGQAMVYGDKRPHLVALIVPDPEFAADWSKEHETNGDLASLANDDAFAKAMQTVVDRVNADLSVIERVRRIIVAPDAFTIENEMMTPTLKLRRHVIKEKYGAALDNLYAN